MELRPSQRALVGLGVACLVWGVAAGVMQMLGAQAPYTPLEIGALEGPWSQVRESAFTTGLGLLAAAWLVPRFAPHGEPRVLVALAGAGTVLSLGAMTWAASGGMLALQAFDVRPGTHAPFYVRVAGQGLLALCLLEWARRLAFPPAAPAASDAAKTAATTGDGAAKTQTTPAE